MMQNKVSLKCLSVFLAIAVIGCAVDLATKSYFFDRLDMPNYSTSERKVVTVIEGILVFETHLNEGALFGIGQGQSLMFAGLSLAAAAGILYWLFWMGAGNDRLLLIALGCVMAGIFGNLYDRIGLHSLQWQEKMYTPSGQVLHEQGDRVYAVRDWIHFKIDSIGFDWPIFNIADVLLVCGAGMLLLHAILVKPPEKLADTPSVEKPGSEEKVSS